MRLTGYGKRSSTRLDVQMTPMIDVVFQLLIFFVCTVNMQGSEQSQEVRPMVDLKKSSEGGAATTESVSEQTADLPFVEIAITRKAAAGDDGKSKAVAAWAVNKVSYATLPEVAARLDALAAVGSTREQVPVYIDVADEVSVGDAVATYDLCLNRRFAQVHFVAK